MQECLSFEESGLSFGFRFLPIAKKDNTIWFRRLRKTANEHRVFSLPLGREKVSRWTIEKGKMKKEDKFVNWVKVKAFAVGQEGWGGLSRKVLNSVYDDFPMGIISFIKANANAVFFFSSYECQIQIQWKLSDANQGVDVISWHLSLLCRRLNWCLTKSQHTTTKKWSWCSWWQCSSLGGRL